MNARIREIGLVNDYAKSAVDGTEANISASRLGTGDSIRPEKLPRDLLEHLVSLCKPLAAIYRYFMPAEMLSASVAGALRGCAG